MYDPIAEYYEEIFPLSDSQVSFIESAVIEGRRPPGCGGRGRRHRLHPRLLDVGCAVGDLAATMALKGVEVDAIDLNPAMIRRARKRHDQNKRTNRLGLAGVGAAIPFEGSKRPAPLRFHEMNMLEIDRRFQSDNFDAVSCLGNTLVHLPGPDEIDRFFRVAARILRTCKGAPGGTLILQILNYDYLLELRPKTLPSIETERLRFERRYSYPTGTGRYITFSTRLRIKAGGEEYEDSVQLYPLRRAELEVLLKRTGFKETCFYGGFDASPLQPESFPLIAVACI